MKGFINFEPVKTIMFKRGEVLHAAGLVLIAASVFFNTVDYKFTLLATGITALLVAAVIRKNRLLTAVFAVLLVVAAYAYYVVKYGKFTF